MQFVKAHGAGNDFVLLPDLQDSFVLDAGLTRALARPHVGLGADGVIRLGAPRPGVAADVFMDYRNADGSLAETCGNGIRCVAKYLADRGLAASTLVRVDTRAGVKTVDCLLGTSGLVERARVDMGSPVPLKVDLQLDVQWPGLAKGGGTVHVTTVSMGNPHAVIVVDDLAHAPVAALGPVLQRHEEFVDGTNVEFISVSERHRVAGRIWERGVGETLASGSGGAAMAVAANLLGLADRNVTVALPGGELYAEWGEETLYITGPAAEIATGEVDDGWLVGART